MKLTTIAKRTNRRASPSWAIIGDITHHQDQSIWLVSFKPTKRIVRRDKNDKLIFITEKILEVDSGQVKPHQCSSQTTVWALVPKAFDIRQAILASRVPTFFRPSMLWLIAVLYSAAECFEVCLNLVDCWACWQKCASDDCECDVFHGVDCMLGWWTVNKSSYQRFW